jgi:RNA polymerase sigma factor (sigma-70 family)
VRIQKEDMTSREAPGTAKREGEVIQLPQPGPSAVQVALDELELVYAFVFARVGNRPDAEDLTQQVALKALPRLRSDASEASIRAYLFATARSVLAGFWSKRFGIAEEELPGNLAAQASHPPLEAGGERVARILERLPDNYRRVLELRFLRGYSLKETAQEVGTTTGNVKVIQLRALRAAAKVAEPDA